MAAKNKVKNDDWKKKAEIKGWVLIILGLLGLLQATNYVPMPWYFNYLWAIIVLIMGIDKLRWIYYDK